MDARPIDVLFLSTSGMLWGAERSLLTTAGLLTERADMRVAVASPNPAVAAEWAGRGPFGSLPESGSPTRRMKLGLLGLLRFAPRGGVVVIFDLLTLPAAAVLRPWLRWRGTRVVLDVHDSVETRPRLRSVLWLAHAVDQVVCVSEYIAAQIPRRVPRTVVHRAIVPPSRTPSSARKPVVAIVGVVLPHKNVLLGLEAAAHAASEPDVLVIGEAPRTEKAFEAEVDRLGLDLLGGRYHRQARRPHAEVLDGVDVLLFLNPTEPSGRIVAEAQAAGVPVVCTDSGGAAEFVRDGETGWAFRAGDVRSAAAALDSVLGDAGERARRVALAKAWAITHYSPREQADRYAEELKRR